MTAVGPAPRAPDVARPGSLRILVVTNMYPTEDEPWYGCFVRDQVESLRAMGVDVVVLSFDGRREPLNYLRAAGRIRRLVARERFDLVHAHYGLTGAVAAVQRKVPLVTTFHGSDYSGWSRWQLHVSRRVARRSTAIVTSPEGRIALGRRSAAVIPCGVDTDRFAPVDRTAARRRLGWDEGVPYVLFPGNRANRVKRADLFEEALAEARQEVADLRDETLHGMSREDAALALNAADVMLMTSDREGSPVTVRESLACMTPVVSVEVGDVPEVLAGLPGCSIRPRDPAELAAGILEALRSARDPSLRQRAESTSQRAVSERVMAVYTSVLSASRK